MSRLFDLFGIEKPVAIVTGSGSARVGNCIAHTLAARGYRLVIHANHSKEAAEQTARKLSEPGTDAITAIGDLRDDKTVQEILQRTQDHFGRIDVLVNSAAIWQSKRLEDVESSDVREHFEVNTLGTWSCCKHIGLAMAEQTTGGAIVNIGDWATTRPYLNYSAYFPSKGAIPTLTRNMAVELANRNPRVRVNAVLPGPVMLPPDLPESERQAAINATLVRREGSPQNVADAVVSLVENDFITGVCLPVDGGRSVFAPDSFGST